MRVVGVKQLKARLSEYLREVRRGEVFLVTDREQVVAELRPARASASAPADAITAAFEALAEKGDVQPPRLSSEGWKWTPTGAGLPTGSSQRLLDQLRGSGS
jgi:antitoxin (DNA-binding transcriptional repressor) of toxin-antitoxin stability system